MNYTSYTNAATSTSKPTTLKSLNEVLAKLRNMPEPEYMLACPDGRILRDKDPWRLAAMSGALPEILKCDPMEEMTKQGDAS